MSNQELFDRAFAKYGGLGNFEYGDPSINKLKSKMLEAFRHPVNQLITEANAANRDFPKVYIDLIANFELNAVAAKYDNKYLIGVSGTNFIVLNNIFSRMLCSRENFTDVGNMTTLTNENYKLHNPQHTSADTLWNVLDKEQKIIPQDKSRFHLSWVLTIFSMQFLALHEYGHVVNGHLDYLYKKYQLKAIEEMRALNSPLDGLFSQTLEMDADSYATTISISQLIRRRSRFNLINPDVQEFFYDFKKMIYYWLFAVYAFFRLYGMKQYSILELKTYSHPPCGMRQLIIFKVVEELLRRNNAGDDFIKEYVQSLWKKVVSDVEKAFQSIAEIQLDQSAFNFAISRECKEHEVLIMKHWEEVVRPSLLPHTFAILPE